jgi:PAS domain S-box-containing protein
VNPVGLKKSGLSESDILGKSFTEFVREDYVLTTKAFYKHQFDSRTPTTYYEFPLINKNGEEFWVGQSVQIRHKDNYVLGFQALARDITVRKKIETELLEAKILAEQSLKAKEHFLSVMSHEIRTPLNAVVGLSNLLMAEKHSEDQKEYLDGLKYSTDNLLSVINDVLDFSKIESNKIHLENIDFNLTNLLKRVQEITRVAAIKKGLDIDLTVDSTIPKYVKGDPVRLNQVLVNLVSNAIKFTEKGTIELIIYNRKESDSNVEIQFVIKDTGIGISSKQINYIFEPFTQASSETTRKYGGSGLGLTISKKLINLMGGKIKVDSKINRGSTFKVNIKFDKTEEVDDIIDNEKSISLSSLSKNLEILIVEDNEMNQFVIQKNLDNWKIKHSEAFDGEQALKILLKKRFDLILLDLEMPKMDGYQLSKEIRANEIDTPIIAISATNTPKSINLALSNGANDFLSKPIDNKLLISKIIQYTSLDNIIENKGVKSKIVPNKNTSNKTINLDYLISSSAGDTIFMEKMINSFIINTPGYLKRLNTFYKKKELENLRTEAHKFKATLSIMGVFKGKKLIEKLETAIETNKGLKKLPNYLFEIETESNLACKELATILTKSA